MDVKKMVVLNQRTIILILCIICFLSALFAVIIAKLSPAVGYEPSIYKSTPILVWVSIIFLIITGIIITISQIFYEKLDQSKLWLIGLSFIFLSYTICLSLYIIRGYYMWCMGGDSSTHIEYVNQILFTGHIQNQLFYPALHIYSSQLHLISNIDLITLHKILPLIFGILYVPFIYLFSKAVFSEKNKVILSTIAGSTLINGWYLNFTPNGLSNLFFPLLLFIFLKVTSTKDVRWELLILIMAFSYPLFHVVPVASFIIFISTFFLPNYISNKKTSLKISANEKDQFLRLRISLLVLLFVWSLTWISSFYVWDYTVNNVYTLLSEGGPTKISELVKDVNDAQGYGYNVIEQALKTLGGPLVYSLLAVISFPIIWKNKDKEKLDNLFSLYGPLFFICLFIIVLYCTNFVFGPLRLVSYITMISTPFVGYILYYFITKIKVEHKIIYNFFLIGLIILLFIVWINGILTLYPSPYTLETNYQTTQSEVDGINWLFENKNLDLETIGMTITPFRFGEFLLTPEQQKIQKLHEWSQPDYLRVPYHFGYENKSSLSDYYNQSLYMGINEKDKSIYVDVFSKMADIRWTQNDFEKLDGDISIEKIYSSKKFEVFYIPSSGKK